MGEFGITSARQRLGFTPTTNVRANIQAGDIGTGAAIGQAVLAGAGIVQKIACNMFQ